MITRFIHYVGMTSNLIQISIYKTVRKCSSLEIPAVNQVFRHLHYNKLTCYYISADKNTIMADQPQIMAGPVSKHKDTAWPEVRRCMMLRINRTVSYPKEGLMLEDIAVHHEMPACEYYYG